MAKPSFKYQRRERTVDDIRRKASEGSRDYDNLFKGDVKLFKPSEGENIIRIMPATWGTQPYSDAELGEMSKSDIERLEAEEEKYGNGWDMPIFVHYGVGPDNASYLCREKMLGERCPICEAKATSRDPDEADKLSPTKRGLSWIVDRNAEKDGPMLWSMPFSKIRNEIYSRSIDKKHGTPIMVDNVDEGFDIIFNRAGKDDRTNYTAVEVDRDATPLHDDEKKQQKWLDYIMEHPLQELLNFYDPDHIEKVLFGRAASRRQGAAEAVTEDEDAASSGRGARRALRGRQRASEGEEADYLGGEEEADVPVAGTRSRAAPARGRGRTEVPEDDPDEEAVEAAPRSPGRRTVRRGRAPADEQPDEAEEGEVAPDSPSDQARGRLRSLRDRRSR